MVYKKAKMVVCILCVCISIVLSGCGGTSDRTHSMDISREISETENLPSASAETINSADEETPSPTSTVVPKSETVETPLPEPTQKSTAAATETPVPTDAPVSLSEEELLSRYENVINRYRELIAVGFDPNKVSFDYFADINGRVMDLYRRQNPGIFYTFIDFANDGISELVLAVSPEDSDSYELFAIYGMDGDIAEQINEATNYGGEDGYFTLLEDGRISETVQLGGGMFPQAKVYRIKPNSCEKEVNMEVESSREGTFAMREGQSELEEISQEECEALMDEIYNLPEYTVSDWKRLEAAEMEVPGPESVSFAELREMMNWNDQELVENYGDRYWFQELGNGRYMTQEMYIEGLLFSVEWWASDSMMISVDCKTFDPELNAENIVEAICEVEGDEYIVYEEDMYTWFEVDKAIVFEMHDQPARIRINMGG